MHLSTLTLNQLRYGELDPDETRSVRAHLDACENCRTRLQSQEAHRQAFVLEPVPEALRKPALPSRRPWTWLVPVLALAALLLVVPRLMSPIDAGPTPVEPETTNTKGAGILLEAWLETDDGPLLLADNTVLEAGDIIQLRYNAEEYAYVSFGGLDGTGRAEIYGTYSSEGGIQTAPFALNIDRAPGDQRFYALFTEERPPERVVTSAIQTQTPPRGGILRSMTFRKPR